MSFPVRLVDQGLDWPAIVQAVGSIAAIVAGFIVLAVQNWQAKDAVRVKSKELATTVGNIALEATETVAQRLESALRTQKGRTLFALRGHRTTEMVQSMREFDLSVLPPVLAGRFARVRSGVYAVNSRITDIFDSEKITPADKSRRRARLESSARVLSETLVEFQRLREALEREVGVKIALPNIAQDVTDFMIVAVAKSVSPKEAFD